MSPSIEEARAAVHSCLGVLMKIADDGMPQAFWAFEKRTWSHLLALGRALTVLFLARQAARPRVARYTFDGLGFELRDWRTSTLGTRFGKVAFTRQVGRPVRGRKVKADLIVDRELGLCSGFSLGVVLHIARLYAAMSYRSALIQFEGTHEWAPSPRAAMRMVDAVGARARSFIEASAAPEDDGEVLVLQVDGGGAPMISHLEYAKRRKPKRKRNAGTRRGTRQKRRREQTQPRRTKGQKSKNSKVAFLAVIYTLAITPQGVEGPINKRVIGTFVSHRALFEWLRVEAVKRGCEYKKVIFIADGSDHIWRLQKEFFPKAEACLDWYHMMEYLWVAGRSLYKEGSKQLAAWVKQQAKRMREAKLDEVVTEIDLRLEAQPRRGPGNKGKRERLQTTRDYLATHRDRLPYASFLARDLDIGSGAIEGAIRNVVRMRLDGPGMRWSRNRSELLLHLRCVLVSDQWADFTDHLVLAEQVKLAAQPTPATPHTAKPQTKAAA